MLDEGREISRALELAAFAASDSGRADHLDTHARALAAAGRCKAALSRAREAAALEPEFADRRNALAAECGANAR
jgi:Flp pilus assembly protein TadD